MAWHCVTLLGYFKVNIVSVYMCTGTRMKVHIADGVSTGDNFLHPLGEIREVLERYSLTGRINWV